MKKRIAILISGRGSNMEAIAKNCKDGILKNVCEIAVVIANKKEAKGLFIAKRFDIPTQCVLSEGRIREEFEKELIEILRPYAVDLIVLAGFMRIFSPLFIRKYPRNIVNIHPADPALFQGLGGYQWAYKNNLKKTTITVHYVDEGIDTGQIIAKEEIDIEGLQTLEEIERRGLQAEHRLYSEALKKIFKN